VLEVGEGGMVGRAHCRDVLEVRVGGMVGRAHYGNVLGVREGGIAGFIAGVVLVVIGAVRRAC
jgi:hypothetical protein